MPPVSQVQSFGAIRLEGQGNSLTINQVIQIAASEVKTRPFEPESPYVGLRRFEAQYKQLFFGRDQLVAEILLLIAQRPLVLVAGASGSGKSSVVRAGVVPQLVERLPAGRFRALVLTPDQDPFVSLHGALLAAGLPQRQLDTLPQRQPETLVTLATALRPPDEQWLIFVDQFEELFTRCADPARQAAFIAGLVGLAGQPQADVRVVLGMRSDFFDRFSSYPEFGKLTQQGLCLVLDMQPSELRMAIEQPAALHGVVFEEGLVEQIITAVQGRPGALPLLQYTLDRLWRQSPPRPDDRTLKKAAYAALGGVEGALRLRGDTLYQYADVASQAPRPLAMQEAMRQVFLRLVDLTSQGTDARAVSRRALRSDFGSRDEQQMIAELVDEKLLVSSAPLGSEQATGPATVEIAHEALLSAWPRLKGWIERGREVIYIRNRLAADARRWNEVKVKKPGAADDELWGGTRLAQAEELRTRGDFRTMLGGLTAEEAQFLDASHDLHKRRESEEAERLRREREAEEQLAEEKRQKEQQKLEAAQTLARRTRLAAVVLGVFFLAAAVAGVLAVRNAAKAARNATEAQKNEVEATKNAAEAKKKANESYATLLVALAQTVKDDPTAVATILREPGHQASTLWSQSALDALQMEIAEIVLRGHNSGVTSVAFSPDGRRLVTGSSDTTARIWNADGLGAPLVLNGRDEVKAAAFSLDGKKLVILYLDATIRIWNADGSGSPLVLKGHESAVTCATLSPDGKKLVTGSADGNARIWNTDGSGAPLVLKGHDSFLLSVAFSLDGKKIVTGSSDNTARIWNADGSGPSLVLDGHKSSVDSVAFSTDEKKVVTGSSDNTARIWNADGSGIPRELKGHVSSVLSVAFSLDGKKVVTGSSDNTARIWNADGSGSSLVLRGHKSPVASVAFSADGEKVVTGSLDATARIWNVNGASIPIVLRGHEYSISSVAFSPDGKKIVTGSGDGLLRISGHNTARIWNADGSGSPLVLKGHEYSVTAVAFSSDGKKIATGSADKTARIWNANGSDSPLVLNRHDSKVTSVAFSPDGKTLATGSTDKTARIWNADGSGSPLVLSGHESAVTSVAFSPNGKRLATSTELGTVRLWNADGSGSPVVFHRTVVWGRSVAFSPDGKRLVTGNGTARLWNADGSGSPLVLNGHESGVTSVAFSPDGKTVVAGSGDKTARIWNADGSGSPLVLNGHESRVTSVAFSPDGKTVVTGSGDKTARIWIVDHDLLLEALWSATSDCLPERRRQELLAESPTEAKQGYARCRAEVARRRGWTSF